MKFFFKRKVLLAFSVIAWIGSASAQVVGGGATLSEGLYGKAQFPLNSIGILNKTPASTTPANPLNPNFIAYVGVGSGVGKSAFFQNNSNLLVWNHDGYASTPNVPFYSTPVTVDYAGSDSLVTEAEQSSYDAHPTLGKTKFGRLIQVPVALTSVTVPYNIAGRTSVNLTSTQLAHIFADPTIINWNQVPGFSALNQPIKVIYRAESSGMTEIFLRHLNAVNNTLVPSVSSTFSSVVNVSNTSKYIGVTGSGGVMDALANNPYSIGYESPDKVTFGDPAKVVAITRVIRGVTQSFLPPEVNVTAALTGINPPPAWVPATSWGIGYVASGASPLANPSDGYPIVGATNLIFSQCYASAVDNVRIRNFFRQHYNTTDNDAAIAAHSFIKLPANWRAAVYTAFAISTSPESIGYTSICAGKGRPA